MTMPPPMGAPRDKNGNVIPTVTTPANVAAWEHRTAVVSSTMFGGKTRTAMVDQVLASHGAQGFELVQALYNVNIAGARDGLLLFFKRRC